MTYHGIGCLEKSGQAIQFNAFNKETLLDARQHPEKYRNLQVRVCGWNIPWNNMSKKNRMLNFKSRKSA